MEINANININCMLERGVPFDTSYLFAHWDFNSDHWIGHGTWRRYRADSQSDLHGIDF